MVAASPNVNSFELAVSIQTTDLGDVHLMKALLNLGATGLFIHPNFVKQKHLTTKPLSCPIPMYNIDGSANEAGSILEVMEVVL